MPDDAVHARYQQVLAWRAEGVSYTEIGRQLGISRGRAASLGRQARHWEWRERVASIRSSAATPITAEMPLDVLPVNLSVKMGFWRAGLRTIGEVAALSDAALLGMRGIGPGTVAVLRAYLAEHGDSVQ